MDGLGVQEGTGSTSLLRDRKAAISGDTRGQGIGKTSRAQAAEKGRQPSVVFPWGQQGQSHGGGREGLSGTVTVSCDRTEETVGRGVLKRKPRHILVIS